jgi:hypothetical protein
MHKDLLAQSPLLVLPLVALFLFLGVFLAVLVRTMVTRTPEYARTAALPLEDSDERQ